MTAWRRANPARHLLHLAKRRAKRDGREFTLTLADITPLPSHCPVLGIPLGSGAASFAGGNYTLDRIDNDRGYTPDNVVVVSARANILKRDATPDELLALAAFYATKRPPKR